MNDSDSFSRNSREQQGDLRSVAGLWKQTSARGNTYLGGRIQEELTIQAGSYFMVFANERTTDPNDRSPDFRVLVAPPRDDFQPRRPSGGNAFDDLGSGQGSQQTETVSSSPAGTNDSPGAADDTSSIPEEDDNLPF